MKHISLIPALSQVTCAAVTLVALAGTTADSQNQPVLRVTTRLVVVNVVVRDKKGAPVQRLTRDDFTVLDGGQPQKISFFSMQSGRSLQQSLQLLPANAYSNRVSKHGDLPASATAILLDGDNTKFEDRVFARQQLIRFLAQLQPEDRVAIYVLGRGGIGVIQDFTTDPEPLLDALEHYQQTVTTADTRPEANSARFPALNGQAAVAASRLDNGISLLMDQRRTDNSSETRTRVVVLGTEGEIEAISHHLSGFPGRKSIIWLTDSVPAPDYRCVESFAVGSPGGSDPLLALKYWHMVRALNQDDVAIYPVDARGLFVDPTFNAETSAPPPTFASGANALSALYCVTARANYLAQQTGGESFHDTNDLKSAIRKALDDSAFTYTLGYYPDHGQWDGSYRSIKVQVDVKGVGLRYRQGYFALAEQPPGKGKARLVQLQEAADNPLEATSIGLTVLATPFRGSRGEKLEVEVSLDPHDLEFRPQKGRWTGLIDIWIAEYSKQGRSLRGFLKTIQENWKDPTYRSIMQNGLSITNYVSVRPDAQELRVVVRDALSGSLGSVRIPLRNLSEVRAVEYQ